MKDLYELLDVPKPTISRLASVLEQQGLLQRSGTGFRLGPKTFELGALFARQYCIDEVGRPTLKSLADQTLQTSCLAVLTGRYVLTSSSSLRPGRSIT